MRRLSASLTTLVGAVAASALLLALPAPAANSARASSLTIRLISTAGHFAYRDRPPKGPSKGDVYSVRSVLRNQVAQFGKRKGAVVGKDYAVLTLTSAKAGIAQVRVYLPGGSLRAKGKVDATTDRGVSPVVGGTGTFANARGTVYYRRLSERRALNVYHLQIP